jgi:acetylornithine deacetylase
MNRETASVENGWSARTWLERLVEIDTTSRNSNLGLIELARDYLRSCGLKPRLTFDRQSTKANLFCSVPNAHGTDRGGWIFSGHTDVVPVDGQNWDTDPFVPTLVGNRVYGRGTADMKGFIAVVLAQVPALLKRNPSKPVHIALSFDEEVGCLGAPMMLEDLLASGVGPEGCLVGEPTSLQVVCSHKEYSVHRCSVTGQPAHSSVPMAGENAIERAADLVQFIRRLSDELRSNGMVDHGFDVPYSSIQTSLIHGGSAANIVPGSCQFDFSIRNLPDVEMQSILDQVRHCAQASILPSMKARTPSSNISFETLIRVPGLKADPESALFKLLSSLCSDNAIRKVAYGSEAGLFQRAGIPAVICGPGDIVRAHRENEYIELRELDECERLVRSLIRGSTANDQT